MKHTILFVGGPCSGTTQDTNGEPHQYHARRIPPMPQPVYADVDPNSTFAVEEAVYSIVDHCYLNPGLTLHFAIPRNNHPSNLMTELVEALQLKRAVDNNDAQVLADALRRATRGPKAEPPEPKFTGQDIDMFWHDEMDSGPDISQPRVSESVPDIDITQPVGRDTPKLGSS